MKPTKEDEEEEAAVWAMIYAHPEYGRAMKSMASMREAIGECPLDERNRAMGFLAEILSSPVPVDAQSRAANPTVQEEQAVGRGHAQRFIRLMQRIFAT